MDEWIGWLIAVLENGIVVQPQRDGSFVVRLDTEETEEQQPVNIGKGW